MILTGTLDFTSLPRYLPRSPGVAKPVLRLDSDDYSPLRPPVLMPHIPERTDPGRVVRRIVLYRAPKPD